MGDNFLEGQAGNTKKRRAKSTAEMQVPKLNFRPDEMISEFTVDCRDGISLSPGEILRCFPGASGVPVDVARDHQNIGFIGDSGGGESLRSAIELSGFCKVRVSSFDALSSTAQVQCVAREHSNG
jgi:hypothetical protein